MNRTFLYTYGVALVLAIIVRLPAFSRVPIGLNRDEAALGYNAYSILKTGRDEYGKLLPISITSFGDQKLPGYVYVLIPFIQVLGLNASTVRLPSLLAGFVILGIMGVLAQKIGTQLGLKKSQVTVLSAVTMALIAISPWGNHFSRVAYEAHLAMAFFTSGLLSYVIGIEQKSSNKQSRLFIITAALWACAMLTYHSYHILVPLIVLALFFIDKDRIGRVDKKGIFVSFGIGLFAILLMLLGGVWSGNIEKSQGISPFHKESLLQQAFVFRNSISMVPNGISYILFNRATEAFVRFSENVVKTFSGEFFFIHGSLHPDHNPGGVPNMHLFLAPCVVYGFLKLWELRKQSPAKRWMIWISLCLLIPSFTIDPLHTVRISPMFPALEMLAAFGMVMFVFSIQALQFKRLVILLLIVVATWSTTRLMIQYLRIVPQSVPSHEKYHLLAKAISKYKSDDLEVITQSPSSSPYIWYIFEAKYDPATLQKGIERYPEDQEHFQHVKRIDHVFFETIQWGDLDVRAKKHPLILIFEPKEMSDKRTSSRIQFLEALKDVQGNTAYEVWRYQ